MIRIIAICLLLICSAPALGQGSVGFSYGSTGTTYQTVRYARSDYFSYRNNLVRARRNNRVSARRWKSKTTIQTIEPAFFVPVVAHKRFSVPVVWEERRRLAWR